MISNFIILEYENATTKIMPLSEDKDIFFYEVSKILAFDDCSNETVKAIYFNNHPIHYVGWQPNMKYEYKDLNGNTVWVGEFPQWDH